MAVILKNSVFVHVPKTGGSWIKNVLLSSVEGAILLRGKATASHESVSELLRLQKKGFPPDLLTFFDVNGVIREKHEEISSHLQTLDFTAMQYFAFVREPLDYWRSFWKYRMGTFWSEENYIDAACASNNFSEFIDNVLQNYPGDCTNMYNALIPEDYRPAFRVGKYENLRYDLKTILHELKEPLSEDIILNTPPANVSRTEGLDTYLNEELMFRLYQAETGAYQRFGYEPVKGHTA